MGVSKNISQITVFVDFDGTITLDDVGDELFRHFGAFEPYNTELKEGKLTIKEYWKILCDSLPSSLSLEEIRNYAKNFQIDAYFSNFINFCRYNDFRVYIISDGFDVYIETILYQYGFEVIPFFANKLIKRADGGFSPEFTAASESCNCFCASCKRNKLLNLALPESAIVYIGDGYSDFCAAEHSDIVFAKKNLARYCQQNTIPHHNFKSFFDVEMILKKAVASKSIRVRHQAYSKREKAFINE